MSKNGETNYKMYIFSIASLIGIGALTLNGFYKYYKSAKKIIPKIYNPLPFSKKELTVENFENILKSHSNQFMQSKAMEEILPREIGTENDLKNWSNNLNYSTGKNDLLSLTKGVSEPVWDLLDRGGKRWRPVLSDFLAETFYHNFNDVKYIAALCEMIHNASLIMDDIEDNSKIRREKPCVHLIYGLDVSANAGTFIYYLPMHFFLQRKLFPQETLHKLLGIYLEEMVHIHIGQGWDIMWHNIHKMEGRIPSEEQYLQMTAHKTGVLARLVVRMTCVVLDVKEDLAKKLSLFSERIGVAFQIQDDLLNIEPGEKYLKTKGYCGEDIHEGKMSIMVIHSLNNSTKESKDRLLKILAMKTEDPNLINEAINIMRNSGSLKYAKEMGCRLIREAWDDVKNDLPENIGKEKIRLLAEYIMSRNI